ncbi:MAG: DUF4159 domain-containing protein [Gemmatimonadota bacterium]|nr:DUF4159 domain-containing protein [Gemmatimonadota bacterium]MDH3424588.1 DUF4159 domain-containing protein [Gemmatimonadota bacterium]
MLIRAAVGAVSAVTIAVTGGIALRDPPAPAAQGCCAYYPYDGAWTFVRVQTASGYGGFRGGGGWSHDYPAADINLSTIMRELTLVDARERLMGGNVLTFDDPRLMQFPFAYVSEPDEWRATESEARGLREYLLKGGFVIFDDFFGYEMANLHRQMNVVFPELSYIRLDGTEEIWDTFYRLEAQAIYLQGPNKNGTPEFWGLFEDNDKSKRMLSIANAQADIGDLWEWAAEGWYPVDPTNDAFKMGVNYIVYALTH